MKALASVAGAVAGLLVIAGIALLVRPYFLPGLPPAVAPGSSLPPDAAGSDRSRPPSPDHPVTTPPTEEEKLREALFRQRIPYFRFLEENTGAVVERFSVPDDDHRTLDMVLTRSDSDTVAALVRDAVAPSASRYAFRRVRFYIHSPAGSLQPLSLLAETTYDGSGRWNTFYK